MNYCPDCGNRVEFVDTEDDVATFHSLFRCTKCTAEWEETVQKGSEEKVLHISPVREEGGD